MEIARVVKQIEQYWDERSSVFDKELDTEDMDLRGTAKNDDSQYVPSS